MKAHVSRHALHARQPLPDLIRGLAVLLMVAYHFSFDLDHYGLIHQSFNQDLRWLAFRALIVSLFMGTLGASVVLAHPPGLPLRWPALWRRQLRLGMAAAAVSAGSALMFPESWIWFGILHFAWVATWLALPLRSVGWPLLVLAAVAALAGNGPASPTFDSPWLGWIGLMTHKPFTEDYVPLLPWFAAVLVGIWTGRQLAHATSNGAVSREGRLPTETGQTMPAINTWAIRFVAALRRLGRHSLLIYLLHQPVMIGLFELRARLLAQ